MDDKEWRTRLDKAHERLVTTFQEQFVAQIKTEILYALHQAERDHARICRSMLDKLNVAYERLLADPRAEAEPSNVTFRVLATEVRGEAWQNTGLEKARLERDAARETADGVNLEFLVRMWLEWRLRGRPDAR